MGSELLLGNTPESMYFDYQEYYASIHWIKASMSPPHSSQPPPFSQELSQVLQSDLVSS